MSAEGRERIRQAQLARWAAKKAETNGSAPLSLAKAKKRIMSPEGRANIIAALKKRHAAARRAKLKTMSA